ncbi:MAG TPA: ribonuclease Y [Candidatus Acidoferrum sp.]|nr:ribonuclease Y [Candidatus Acidoferrum sp.]
MNSPIDYVLAGAIIPLVGVLLGIWIWRHREGSLLAAAGREKTALLEAARREAEAITRDARLAANEEALKLRSETEQRLNEREALVNGQLENLVRTEKSLQAQREELEGERAEVERLRKEAGELAQQRRERLAGLSKLSEAEARAAFLQEVEGSSLRDAAQMSQHILEEAKTQAEEKARRIISVAIQRYAGNHTFENTTATVNIKGDDMKGRIIGREGRNIRAFEGATGVTVLIDDTPGAVVLSGFDPVRREIAREAMERLILDGRIHPARIEEVVGKVTEEMDDVILRTGNAAVMKLGLAPMHVEMVKLLGRLHFRHSFSQNILSHSIEVAQLMGLMAAELGMDVAAARRAGLLHDIGKAVSHEVEGAHALVGAEIARRYGEAEAIVNAVASHHGEAPSTGLLGILVSAADAISASRPGARSETVLTYIKRVEDLERIGLSFPGVEKCFALQAGRELRVMVQPGEVSDEEAFLLARNIARKVEDDLQYPGQIRVTIVRETRCVEFAK